MACSKGQSRSRTRTAWASSATRSSSGRCARPGLQPWGLPVVAETYDGGLNDINGFHVKPAHVTSALDGASGGAVAEGNVGGGTGMSCLGFKGGIGTASRVLASSAGGYTVGVLVQCNFGARQDLRVAGVPVGEEITDLRPCIALDDPTVRPQTPRCGREQPRPPAPRDEELGPSSSSLEPTHRSCPIS